MVDAHTISYRIMAFVDDRTLSKSRSSFNQIKAMFSSIENYFENIKDHIIKYSNREICFQDKIFQLCRKKLKIGYSDNINIKKKF